MDKCPATREAVEEQEERGEIGCPICGRPPEGHKSEHYTDDDFALRVRGEISAEEYVARLDVKIEERRRHDR